MRPGSGTDAAADARPLLAGTGRLPRAFYARPALHVARALLGRVLVSDLQGVRCAGRIVEVEAYGGARDPASHAFRGPTPRNAIMFGPAGHAYVYFTYGMHHCLNIVTGMPGRASAVLVRALEPIEGAGAMRARRGAALAEYALARGPGCVARALGVTRSQNGVDLVHGDLWISNRGAIRSGHRILATTRVGVSVGRDVRWRLLLEGNPCVSGPRSWNLGVGTARGARVSRTVRG